MCGVISGGAPAVSGSVVVAWPETGIDTSLGGIRRREGALLKWWKDAAVAATAFCSRKHCAVLPSAMGWPCDRKHKSTVMDFCLVYPTW